MEAEELGKDGRRWLTPKNLEFKDGRCWLTPKELAIVDGTKELRYLYGSMSMGFSLTNTVAVTRQLKSNGST